MATVGVGKPEVLKDATMVVPSFLPLLAVSLIGSGEREPRTLPVRAAAPAARDGADL